MRDRVSSSPIGLRRRSGIVGSVTAVGILLSGVAAYGWISLGRSTGAGHVVVGAPLQKVEVTGPTNFPLVLDEPVPLSGSFVNYNTFRLSVARVKITVTGVGPGPGTCSIAPGVNFFTTDAVPTSGRFTMDGYSTITGTGSGDWSGGTIEFRSSPTLDQNGCVGRRVNLNYTAVA